MRSFISRFEERVAPAEKRVAEAWWNLAVTGSEEAQQELVEAGTAYNRLFADEGDQEKVAAWYGERDSLDEELLRRQVDVLHRTFAARRGDAGVMERIEELEAETNAVYGNHRGTVGGRTVGENEVRDILRTSPEEAVRREAWEASKTVGREVEGTVRELARLRNRLAREAGYPDHYHRSLDLQEMPVAELEALMSDLEAATEAPFRKLKGRLDRDLKRKFGVETVGPWLLSDSFFQEPPEDGSLNTDRFFEGRDLESLTRETYDVLGLDVRGVVAKSDLYARPGKNQHAFCLSVGRDYPYDVRVLANLRAGRPDAYWMNTMLHEFGHAVYDRHINPGLPYLLRGVSHIATTEAIALMMGSLAEDPGWLTTVAGVPEEDLAREKLLARRREDLLVFTRWALVMFRFEKELYADPDRDDLNRVWWDLVEELQGVPRPPGRDEPDWAAKIHVATAPVYYHNYVLGNLIAAQLRSYLETHITHGPFYENEVAGRYLLESFFGPGARENWRDTVLRATGEHLNPDHFVKSLR
ncbi:MAG TPA: M2 family metallopeptidase [Rubrobacter sp.]|nr:M2 family metallopeptidase [Rubrobacter sp.]